MDITVNFENQYKIVDNTDIGTVKILMLKGEKGDSGVSDYNAVSNKPRINDYELIGNKTAGQLGLAAVGDIPTKTSDLTNDSGFITSSAIPTNVSAFTNDAGYITSAAVPTKTSDLTNDSGFITDSAIPTNVSAFTNDAGYITSASLPTKTSDLTNDSGFITANDIPPIPTNTSDLTNDSGFITSTALDVKLDKDFSGLTAIPQTPTSGDILPIQSGSTTYKIDYSSLKDAIISNAIPTGGTSGQFLAKNSSTDFDTIWITPTYRSASYSTSERLTGGYWVDGRPIYQKTVLISVTQLTGSSASVCDGSGTVINFSGYLNLLVGSYSRPINWYLSNTRYITTWTSNSPTIAVSINVGSSSEYGTAGVTVEYVKDSDL